MSTPCYLQPKQEQSLTIYNLGNNHIAAFCACTQSLKNSQNKQSCVSSITPNEIQRQPKIGLDSNHTKHSCFVLYAKHPIVFPCFTIREKLLDFPGQFAAKLLKTRTLNYQSKILRTVL